MESALEVVGLIFGGTLPRGGESSGVIRSARGIMSILSGRQRRKYFACLIVGWLVGLSILMDLLNKSIEDKMSQQYSAPAPAGSSGGGGVVVKKTEEPVITTEARIVDHYRKIPKVGVESLRKRKWKTPEPPGEDFANAMTFARVLDTKTWDVRLVLGALLDGVDGKHQLDVPEGATNIQLHSAYPPLFCSRDSVDLPWVCMVNPQTAWDPRGWTIGGARQCFQFHEVFALVSRSKCFRSRPETAVSVERHVRHFFEAEAKKHKG